MGMLILGKYLLPGGGEVKDDWGIAMDGQRIIAIGANDLLLAEYSGFEVLDRRDSIISPGFVNAHMHSYGILSHGITPPVEIEDFESFLDDFWWPLVENRIDGPMIKAAGKASVLELVNSGVTAFCDVLEAPNTIPGGLKVFAEVLEEIGIKAVLSVESCERISWENGVAGLMENRDFALEYKDHPRISGMMCTHTTFTCSEPFLRKAAALAREAGSGIQMHLNESKYEPGWCMKHHGKLPVDLYDDIGFLGPDVLASQGVKLTAGEMEKLSQHGVNLVHVPLSNCEVGGGFSPVPDLLARNINVGLGTDGYINNFFEVMRGAFLLHKAARENPEEMPAETVFRMATENGARAVSAAGTTVTGRLEEGSPADFITIRADFPTPVNHKNIFGQVILYRNPGHVVDVCIDGRMVKRDGKIAGFDMNQVRADAVAQAERLWDMG